MWTSLYLLFFSSTTESKAIAGSGNREDCWSVEEIGEGVL